jgi:hypothetical protein
MSCGIPSTERIHYGYGAGFYSIHIAKAKAWQGYLPAL